MHKRSDQFIFFGISNLMIIKFLQTNQKVIKSSSPTFSFLRNRHLIHHWQKKIEVQNHSVGISRAGNSPLHDQTMKKPATILSFWVRMNAKTLNSKVNVLQWLGARRQRTVQYILQLLHTSCATFAFKMSIISKACWKKSRKLNSNLFLFCSLFLLLTKCQ